MLLSAWPPVPRRRRPSAGGAVVGVLAGLTGLTGCGFGVAASPTTTRPPVPVVTSIVGTTSSSTTTTTTTAPTTTTTEPPTTVTTAPPEPAPPAPAGGGRVLVIGDSVLLGAKAQLPAAMPAAEVTVDATENRMVTALASVLAAHGAPGDYRAIVVHLCTNYSKGMAYGRYIDQTMAALAAVPRVVWVTCSEWSNGQPEANQAIRAAAGRYANAAVADWAAVSGSPGYTYVDGIHLKPAGAVAAAAVVAAAVG
jgi:hypothetical protein